MSRKTRTNYTPQEKVAILRRHLLEKVPVSNLCDEHQLAPTLFYQWQKQFFENGAAAFARQNGQRRAEDAKDQKIARLEEKLVKKNEVVAELLEEHVQLKKARGEL
jgi:transposase-like protein